MTWSTDEESVQVDTYLDTLLASRIGRSAVSDGVPHELAETAGLVRGALARFHPSFRFEEELAARLRAVATGAAHAATIVRFPSPAGVTLAPAVAAGVPTGADAGIALGSGGDGRDAPSGERGWVLVGGAIASGISLAAGVLLARRRSRGDGRWERLV